MAAFRRTWTGLVLGSVIFALPVLGQQASSVSLTHTVTVTVPPRVKVQVGAVAPAVRSSATSAGALSISVNATQSWILSIGSNDSRVQWSTNAAAGFAGISPTGAMIASGGISQMAANATLYLRSVESGRRMERSHGEGADAVVLTVVAP